MYPTPRVLTRDWSVNLFVMVLCEKVWPEFSVLNMTVRTECSSYRILSNVNNVTVKYQTAHFLSMLIESNGPVIMNIFNTFTIAITMHETTKSIA